MAYLHGRELSHPVKLYWDGWHSTTLELQKAGWDISVDQGLDSYYHEKTLDVAIRHKSHEIYGRGRTKIKPSIFHEGYDRLWVEFIRSIEIPMMLANDFRYKIIEQRIDFKSFLPIDATPRWVEFKERSLKDLVIFKTINPDAQEIIIPNHSVPELLSMIIDKQDPARQEYYAKKLAERGEVRPNSELVAQLRAIA